MKKCFLVLDYNNVRFKDVKKIREDVRRRYDLSLCLIRPNPTPIDHQIADDVIDLDFSNPDFVSLAKAQLLHLGLNVVGGFPFSDKSVFEGTRLLLSLGVPSDSADLAKAALSKWDYRQAEQKHAEIFDAQNIFRPKAMITKSFEAFENLFTSSPSGLVIKPTNEGNNRGVSIVREASEARSAWAEASPWMHQGLLIEEVIPQGPEYSHDGIAHLDFVTKKFSRTGRYPVENGQEVSADLCLRVAARVRSTGRLVNYLTGSRAGAFHNEIKVDHKTLITSVVEPNRRPAGMSIWDLAEKVFGVSFYSLLIDSVLGQPLPERLPEPKGAAAIRMLSTPFSGRLTLSENQMFFQSAIESLARLNGIEVFNFSLLKENGSLVTSLPKHNGDFLAQVCAYGPSSARVQMALDEIERVWMSHIAPSIQSDPSEGCHENRHFAPSAI